MQKIANALVFCAILASCKSVNFNGGQRSPDSTDNSTGAVVSPKSAKACVNEASLLRTLILLDTSGSMGLALAEIKKNLDAFVDALKTIQPSGLDRPLSKVEVGLMTFEDSPDFRRFLPFTSDLNAFKKELAIIDIQENRNNIDGPEEGLAAFEDGLGKIVTHLPKENSVLCVLVVTDNFAHRGGEITNRDMSLDQISSMFKNKNYEQLSIFDSAPPFPPDNYYMQSRYPQETPAKQWQEIRKKWQESHTKINSNGGAQLVYPFDARSIISILPRSLEASLQTCR